MLLCTDVDCIRNGDLMAVCDAVCSVECKGSYGTAFFDHLAADGAGFTAGQVTVVTVGQVDAHFGSSLHLEAVHSLAGLGNIDLVVVLHSDSLLFIAPFHQGACFLGKSNTFRRKHFSFRKHSFALRSGNITVSFRKFKHFLEKILPGKNTAPT